MVGLTLIGMTEGGPMFLKATATEGQVKTVVGLLADLLYMVLAC
jgi:hypothetical protein